MRAACKRHIFLSFGPCMKMEWPGRRSGEIVIMAVSQNFYAEF